MLNVKGNSYKVVCIDYYGTLVDIIQPFEKIQEWIENNVHDKLPIYTYMLRKYAQLATNNTFMCGNNRLVESLRFACNKWDISISYDDFSYFIFDLFSSPTAYPDAHEAIRKLTHSYCVGVASNADNDIINASIKKNNFSFDFVITSEDACADKPSKHFFSYLQEKVDVSTNNIIMIGDSWKDDVWGASNYDIDSIWINRTHAPHLNDAVSPKWIVYSLLEAVEVLGGCYDIENSF